MLRVGLTGGLASGKSVVGAELARLGCLVVKADDMGHCVLDRDGEAYQCVIDEFGRDILGADLQIDRRLLGDLVFGKPERLKKLNSLVHPPVRARIKALIDAFEQREPNGIAVTEAAILIETGSYRSYDHLIVAVCGEEQQIERAIERDHLTREQVLDRLRRQMPLQEKVKYAHFIVDTSATMESTIEQTRDVYTSLRRLTLCDSEA
jgi:dephospho-CoA kinase